MELAQLCTSPLDYKNVENRALGGSHTALVPSQVSQECPSSSQSHGGASGKQPRKEEGNLLIPTKDHARRERIGLVAQGRV